MAHTRKDTLTAPPEWWNHLREHKKGVARAERSAAKRLIRQEIEEPEVEQGCGLHNSAKAMRKLRAEKGDSVIPSGGYCYDSKGTCPYWDKSEIHEEQNNGFCWFKGRGDWSDPLSCGLLWDQCKECGINEEEKQ